MAKKMDDGELDPRLDKLAADAEESEEDDEEDDEESDDPSDKPREVGDKSEERAPQKKRRRPGRPRKDRTGEDYVHRRSVSASLSEGDDSRAKNFATKDLATIWNYVVEQAREAKLGAEAVAIGVKKLGLGPIPSGEQDMAPINGELVMGDDQQSPGEALVNYITHVYHLPTARTAKLYRCSFWYRTGTQNRIVAPHAELRLGPPEEVQAEINAKNQFAAQKAVDDAVRGVVKPVGYRPQGMGGPPPQYPPTPYWPGSPPPTQPPYPYYPPPPMQGASPELEAMRREMASLFGAINERARLEGLAPPPAPVPVVAPGPTAEETAAKTAQIVAQTLVGLGFTPALAAKLNSPAMTPQGMQQALVSPMEAWRESMKMLREFRQMDAQIREEFAPEEEPEAKQLLAANVETKVEVDKTALRPIPLAGAVFGGKPVNYGEKGEDEGLAAYVTRLAMGNPELAMGFVEKLSNSALAQALPTIIQKLIGAGMPAVAAQMQAKQIAAQSQANGTNGAVVQPPAQPAAASWSMPKV